MYSETPRELLMAVDKSEALQYLLKSGISVKEIGPFEYYSWPKVFGNTSGPFFREGMLAGAAMTTFQMEAWTDYAHTVYFCKGKIVGMEVHEKEPFNIYNMKR